MKITYRILDNATAVIITRQPVALYEELRVTFAGAPEGATAILESGGDSFYRVLDEESCSVPVDKLNGVVKVTVALLDGSTRSRKWVCEELLAEKLKDGGTLVFPNDMNLPQRFIELKLENESIRQTNERIEARLGELENRLERLLEGYDLT